MTRVRHWVRHSVRTPLKPVKADSEARGLFNVSRKSVSKSDGTPRDWTDANLEQMAAAARRVIKDASTSANTKDAHEFLKLVAMLNAYRSAGNLEPAVWQMMCLMFTWHRLDTNVSFKEPMTRYAPLAKAQRKANVTKDQAIEAMRTSKTRLEAADKVGISVRTLTTIVPVSERPSTKRKR